MSSLIIERRPSRRAGQRSPALGALLAHVMLKDGWRVKAEVPQRSKARGAHLFEISEESEGGIVTPSDLKRWMTVGAGGRTEPTGRPFNDIVVIDELASKLGVTEAEARRRLRRSGRSYVELGDVHVTREKLEELEGALAAAPDLRLPTVLGILRGLSCRRPFPVLEALGYAVEWGEDRESSTVRRLRRRPTTP